MKTISTIILLSVLVLAGVLSATHQSHAAVATAKVTVKVVPAAAIHGSEHFGFTIPPETEAQSQQSQSDSNQIEISSLKNKTSVTVQVQDGQNKTYDLSISADATLTGSSSSATISINNMIVDDSGLSNEGNNTEELLIDGELTLPHGWNPDHYTGTTEITVNYN